MPFANSFFKIEDETIAPQYRSKKRTLEELFRRPIDILFSGSFETVRTVHIVYVLVRLDNMTQKRLKKYFKL